MAVRSAALYRPALRGEPDRVSNSVARMPGPFQDVSIMSKWNRYCSPGWGARLYDDSDVK